MTTLHEALLSFGAALNEVGTLIGLPQPAEREWHEPTRGERILAAALIVAGALVAVLLFALLCGALWQLNRAVWTW